MHEKGSKQQEMPPNHDPEVYLGTYINASGVGNDGRSPLFQSAGGRIGSLTEKRMNRVGASGWFSLTRRGLA
jgi:hypothetical protein